MISLEGILFLLISLHIIVLLLNFSITLFNWQTWRQLDKLRELSASLEKKQGEIGEALNDLLQRLEHLATSLDFVVAQVFRVKS